MKPRSTTLLSILFCLSAAPVLAQTTIGGGTCNSSTLNGPYEFTLNGRQTASTGAVLKLMQAVGTAVFDGQSKVTLTITANTVSTSQSFGAPLVYSGTYSLQSNCLGSIGITTGDTATFTLESFNSGNAFAVIGSDATFAYNGNGNNQPATCPTTISGGHEFNGTGNSLSGLSVTGVLDLAGVLQFDGLGNVTANWTQVSNLTTTTLAATGTYSLNSGCLATATLTDAASNKYAISMSFDSAADFAFAMSSPQLVVDGASAAVQATTGASCSAATLSGTYEINLGGRIVTGGVPTKILTSNGAATFDGQSKVTFTLTSNAVNGSQAFGTSVTYSGTYSIQSNCQGSINITSGNTANFAMVAYGVSATTNQANAFTMVGTDATYAYSGGGTAQPSACAVSTLSGAWPFSTTGNSLSGSSNTGVVDMAGELQFDGQGNVTASWTQASSSGTTNVTATGTYSVTPACLGSITLTDTASNKYTGTVSVYGVLAANVQLVGTNPQLIFTGNGHAAFVNPGLAVASQASGASNSTPAGSIFSIYGSNLATKEGDATSLPLPTTLNATTTVTVNGELVPLFNMVPGQVNAQMPWDIKPGVATVIVKNGSSTSNAVAVTIPATGTPGIEVYGNNRAVVVNQDGSVNSAASPAKVGDILTVYFTGGGPVNAAGPLVTGAGSPGPLSPVTGSNTVTVSGVNANITYMGLTAGSVGLYQADFVVPKVAAGDHPLVITIAGQASNNPLIAVSN